MAHLEYHFSSMEENCINRKIYVNFPSKSSGKCWASGKPSGKAIVTFHIADEQGKSYMFISLLIDVNFSVLLISQVFLPSAGITRGWGN